MNTLKEWVRASREMQQRTPERYLASYPELICDDETVMMTQETLDRIERHCGRYEGTFPTGTFLGKMFLRGPYLFWIGIDKERPMTNFKWNSRRIVVIE